MQPTQYLHRLRVIESLNLSGAYWQTRVWVEAQMRWVLPFVEPVDQGVVLGLFDGSFNDERAPVLMFALRGLPRRKHVLVMLTPTDSRWAGSARSPGDFKAEDYRGDATGPPSTINGSQPSVMAGLSNRVSLALIFSRCTRSASARNA